MHFARMLCTVVVLSSITKTSASKKNSIITSKLKIIHSFNNSLKTLNLRFNRAIFLYFFIVNNIKITFVSYTGLRYM